VFKQIRSFFYHKRLKSSTGKASSLAVTPSER